MHPYPAQKGGTGRPGGGDQWGGGGVATRTSLSLYACARRKRVEQVGRGALLHVGSLYTHAHRAKRVEQAGGMGGDNRGREWPRELRDS